MRVPFELRQQFLPYLEKMIHKLNLFLEIGSLFQSLSLNSCFDFLPYTLLLIPYCYWQEILSTLLSSAWGPGTGQCCSLVTITCPTGSIFECFWFLDSEPQILEAYFYFTLSFWRQSSLPLIFFFPFWTEDSVHGSYSSVLTCIFLLQKYFKEPAPEHLVFYSTWIVVSSLPFSNIYHSKVTWLKEAMKRKIWLCLYLANVLIRQQCIM